MKKKRILISSAGTAAGWHVAKIISENFSKEFDIITSDTNPSHLVPASIFAKHHLQVPLVKAKGYREQMLKHFEKNNINIVIPFIDSEVFMFPADDLDLQKIGVKSISLPQHSVEIACNKKKLYDYLLNKQLTVPKVFRHHSQLKNNMEYFVKPIDGYGSINTKKTNYKEVKIYIDNPNYIVTECLSNPEITIEVFNYKKRVETLSRQRIETRNGVCTKAKLWVDSELNDLANNLCTVLDLPTAFCFQVMKNAHNKWTITDINPRLGGGASMSTTYGWSHTAALISTFTQSTMDPFSYLKSRNKAIYINRVYQDIIMQ